MHNVCIGKKKDINCYHFSGNNATMDIITIILVAMYANCWLVGCFVGESTPKKSYKHIVSATSTSALLNITFLIVS